MHVPFTAAKTGRCRAYGAWDFLGSYTTVPSRFLRDSTRGLTSGRADGAWFTPAGTGRRDRRTTPGTQPRRLCHTGIEWSRMPAVPSDLDQKWRHLMDIPSRRMAPPEDWIADITRDRRDRKVKTKTLVTPDPNDLSKPLPSV